jgi:hypothetical protein
MIPIKRMIGLMMKEVDPQIFQILDEKGKQHDFQNRVRGFSDLGRFQTNLKKCDLMTKEVKSYLLDSMIRRLMMKEVNPQIYQILDEKGNTSTFQNRVRGFSDLG